MIAIRKAVIEDATLLAGMAKTTFIQSHGHSASPEEIAAYVDEKFNEQAIRDELNKEANLFHIIYYNDAAAGYSKIILNSSHPAILHPNITKLERLYLLEDFHDKKLGAALFRFIVGLAKENRQAGIWLYVWKQNARAISFYTKAGFIIIGSFDFRISATHSNPNHQLLLLF